MTAISYTLQNVLIGSMLLGVTGGSLGCFALLRRQSLLGDALAHAALPGVCLAYLVTGSKDPFAFLIGALAAGIFGSLFILAVVRWTRVKEDAAIGIVLSVFFAFGIVLLTRIQKMTGGNQAGLDKFLFGQAATLMESDLYLMGFLGLAVVGTIVLLYKEFKIVSFDPDFGASLGFPVRRLEVALTCLLVVVVVAGLQTVGVVLMVATLITPAAAARQWTEKLGVMIVLAGAIGGATGAAGAVASASSAGIPTGPAIVIASSAVLAISILFAPERGILWSRLRALRLERRIRRENLLKDLYVLAERSVQPEAFISTPELSGFRGHAAGALRADIARVRGEGLIEASGDAFRLTAPGIREAERIVRKHRLWEVFLSSRLELPADHLHRDAEAMEHALGDAMTEDLAEILGHPALDPHGRRIPPRPA